MRVMLFGAGLEMTGANLLLYRWGAHLRGQGHEVFALIGDGPSGPLQARYGAAGIKVINSGEVFVDNRTLVICNTVLAAQHVIKLSSFARCIWWLHEGEVGASILGNDTQLQHAFACASAVIFPAPYLIDSIYHGFLFGQPREKLFVVANGVDAPAAPTARRAAGDLVRISTVGTIYSRKRQGDLIRAADALADLPLQCRLVGKVQELDDEFRQIIKARPDRFQLLGELSHEQTIAEIEESDLLVHPSANEALPLVTLEAGIRGKPLVLANLPVYRDIWHHGENCLMHSVGDVALLSHLIAILARDPALRDRFGAAAKATAERYRSEVMLAQLDRVAARVAWPGSFQA
ncbi:MAG TPA: glycosyltransferase family 4 protein [Magnetospirillaceae bacterium]|nr:glycosyltransferase family 4 protein [Magnetospirillaceae bacterium]